MHKSQEWSPQSRVSRLTRWWKNWTGNRAGRAELDNLSSQELGDIARAVGATPNELRALAGKWPDSADLLTRRMAALHLDPGEIAQSQPAVSSDLTKLCSLCGDKKQCQHDLDSGTASPLWPQYCPNSATLIALAAERSPGRSNKDKR